MMCENYFSPFKNVGENEYINPYETFKNLPQYLVSIFASQKKDCMYTFVSFNYS